MGKTALILADQKPHWINYSSIPEYMNGFSYVNTRTHNNKGTWGFNCSQVKSDFQANKLTKRVGVVTWLVNVRTPHKTFTFRTIHWLTYYCDISLNTNVANAPGMLEYLGGTTKCYHWCNLVPEINFPTMWSYIETIIYYNNLFFRLQVT